MTAAQFLNADFRGQKFARTINLLPWAIPLIVATMAFGWLFDDQFGLVNDILYRLFGIRREWLVNPTTARMTVILTNVWKNTPFIAMVFLAGLQGLPKELYDSAKVDGAGGWQSFWRITVPLVSPLVTTISIFFAVWQLATFDIVYGLTQGGPGFATSLLSYQVYQQAFVAFNFGYSSAISIVLLFVVAVIAVVGFSIFKRQEVSF